MSFGKDFSYMLRSIRLALCLAVLSTGWAFAQTPDADTDETTPAKTAAPVAHIYTAYGDKIVAYSAAANGKLTPVPGSPFKYSVGLQGANGHYLFGFEPNSPVIESFSMAANGALKKAASINPLDFASDGCSPFASEGGLHIDHAGLTLYNVLAGTEFPCDSIFQSFRIEDADGKLTYLGYANSEIAAGTDLSILANDKFAYAPGCFFYGNEGSPYVVAYERLSNGELASASASVEIPAVAPNEANPDGYYCPGTIVTDATGHAAMTLTSYYTSGLNYGPVVIATYTADADGNLNTTSTYKNMAALPNDAENGCLACSWLRPSPSGKLLAASGAAGVVLFHFNGGEPLTKYKTILTNINIGQVTWDNDNHLYALGSGKLWVYTVTPTSITEAPGSPYSVTNGSSMVVQPLE
jgi:hypothetical protein